LGVTEVSPLRSSLPMARPSMDIEQIIPIIVGTALKALLSG
jgi:hypothetical protein